MLNGVGECRPIPQTLSRSSRFLALLSFPFRRGKEHLSIKRRAHKQLSLVNSSARTEIHNFAFLKGLEFIKSNLIEYKRMKLK